MRNWSLLVLVIVILGVGIILWSCGQTTTETTPPSPAPSPTLDRPQVTSVSPSEEATGVAITAEIVAVFSKSLEASTITADTFTLFSDSGLVAGVVSYDAQTKRAIFFPIYTLNQNIAYIATISATVKDTAGNQMGSAKTWSFTTGTLPLIKGPSVGSSGNDADQIFRSLAVSPNNPNLIYVGSEGNGIFKSEDGSNTWNWLRSGLKYFDIPSYPEIWEIAIDPNNNNIVYVAAVGGGVGPLTGTYPSTNGGVYKSINGGANWIQKVNDLTNAAISSIIIDPNNPAALYLGVRGDYPSFSQFSGQYFGGGIYKSTNSGESWAKVYSLPNLNTSDFWHLSLDAQTIFTLGLNFQNTSEAIGLLKSTDGGSSWTNIIGPTNTHLTFFDVAPQNKDIIYALQRDRYVIYKSTNGGSTWDSVDFPVSGSIKVSPHNQQVVLFSDIDKLYKSTDGMQTYTIVLTPEGTIDDFEFTSDSNIIYAGTRGLIIYKSTDGGNTFTKIKNLRQYIDSQ